MRAAEATVHGAISIVNAIATGRGSTLGISLEVKARIEASEGRGIIVKYKNRETASRLVNKTIEKIIPKKQLKHTRINVSLESQIPTGYGLKSSSAISTSVALACAKLFRPQIGEWEVLMAGVNASIESKVSITGALDDAGACYFGGFVVTDNYKKRIIRKERCQKKIVPIVFIPRLRKRGNVKRLRSFKDPFQKAFKMAKEGDYWNAMILNGIATSSILGSDPTIISKLVENGALGASISGNGPAIAAVVKKENVNKIQKVFSELEGRTIVAETNNKKASVCEL